MTVKRKKITFKNVAEGVLTSTFKTRLCVLFTVLIAFTSFTAFSTSQSSNYTVVVGDKEYSVATYSKKAKQIAKEAGVKINSNDIITADHSNESVTIVRRNQITVSYHGEKKCFVTGTDTVENTLKKLGIKLNKNDVVSIPKKAKVENGMNISVDKIVKKTQTSTTYVDYDEYLKMFEKGKTDSKKLSKTSKQIKAVQKYETTFVNNEKTNTALKNQTFSVVKNTEKAKSTVASKLTSKVSTTKNKVILDDNGRPVNYKKLYTGIGSAYTGGGTCASGRKAKVGHVAVDPDKIPYGTKLYIRSKDGKYNYGYAIAADTGAFVDWGRVVDLYFDTREECINFGIRDVEVYVLE